MNEKLKNIKKNINNKDYIEHAVNKIAEKLSEQLYCKYDFYKNIINNIGDN